MGDSEKGCVWPYIVIFIIAMTILYCGSRDNDLKIEEKIENEKLKYNTLIQKLNFNTDSLLKTMNSTKNYNDIGFNSVYPTFAYEKLNNVYKPYVFDSLDVSENFTNYDINKIYSITLFYRGVNFLGTYDNGRTVAAQNVIHIEVYDRYTKKLIHKTSILGSSPPEKYNYRRSLPDTIKGSVPKFLYDQLLINSEK
ncbi:hypothetical protein JCM19297_2785 [Nonlabens ulvanivorans]|nr:hypothetical protein [Nonlabens ulvanivorans]GAK88272.1 hypothetical protein JCM19297_2785 [Nonlabens ulvanivorans]